VSLTTTALSGPSGSTFASAASKRRCLIGHRTAAAKQPARCAPVDDRRIISGIVHVLQSSCRWRDGPSDYGPYTTVYNRFNRWSRRQIWQRIYRTLVDEGRIGGTVALDSTHVKAHRSAAGAQKKRFKIRPLAYPAAVEARSST
jgi:transposase